MAMKYSDKVMDHFSNPRNVGEIEGADGVGEVGNPACGDIMTFYIKVKDDKLDDVKFKTFGCGAAIAVSSMVSEMAKGKSLDEVMAMDRDSIAEALDGLPKAKMHCSNLGSDALHAAIKNYGDRKAGKNIEKEVIEHPDEDGHVSESTGTHPKKHSAGCACPYCEKPVHENSSKCLFCGAKLEENNCK